MKRTEKKILFLSEVHGDEKIGTEILDNLKEEFLGQFAHIIANEKASKKNVRFIDCDLNRSAPGEKTSDFYEKKRAYELIEIAKQFDIVIDIHDSTSNTGIFSLVTNPTIKNLALANSLPIKNIVIWPGEKDAETGPLTEFMDCAIEIECGPKNSPKIKNELKEIVEQIIKSKFQLRDLDFKNKKIFKVQNKIMKKDAFGLNNIEDFKPVIYKNKKIIPLLVNQYPEILCYNLTPVDDGKTAASNPKRV